MPEQATVVRDGVETTVGPGELRLGERMLVRLGERLATDGVVRSVPGRRTVSLTPDARQAGSVQRFVAVVAVGLVMMAGMAYDGGHIVAAQAAARGLAASAARAGAQEVDLPSFWPGEIR